MLGLCFLAFSTAILAVGKFQLHLGIEALQTLTVVSIVLAARPRPMSFADASICGFAAQHLARTLFSSRCPYHFDSRNHWNRNGALPWQ